MLQPSITHRSTFSRLLTTHLQSFLRPSSRAPQWSRSNSYAYPHAHPSLASHWAHSHASALARSSASTHARPSLVPSVPSISSAFRAPLHASSPRLLLTASLIIGLSALAFNRDLEFEVGYRGAAVKLGSRASPTPTPTSSLGGERTAAAALTAARGEEGGGAGGGCSAFRARRQRWTHWPAEDRRPHWHPAFVFIGILKLGLAMFAWAWIGGGARGWV